MLLLNAVKDVAISMGTLLEATKNASGKSRSDDQMLKLKVSSNSEIFGSSSENFWFQFRKFWFQFRKIWFQFLYYICLGCC